MTRKIMAVFAHPDDEGAVAGTLYNYAQAGAEITLICATRGEVGEISDPSLATPENLGNVREQELNAAAQVIGIHHIELLDYRDSGMAGTPENEDQRALVQANDTDVVDKLSSLIDQHQPDIIITFEPFGWYGHPDHMFMSRITLATVEKMRSKGMFNGALYYAVVPLSKYKSLLEQAIEVGIMPPPENGGIFEGLPLKEIAKTEKQVTHITDVSNTYEIKVGVNKAHRTQFGDDHMWQKIPKEQLMMALGQEYFIQVYPAATTESDTSANNDLFETI